MSQLPIKKLNFNDGRTKQSFRDETDINMILKRAQKSGTISHLAKYEARYGDFSDFDFFEAQRRMAEGREIFDELPPEIRREFSQSPGEFFAYVNDPANVDRISQLLPELAAPGRQHVSTRGNLTADELTRADATAVDTTPPEEAPEPPQTPDPAPSPDLST